VFATTVQTESHLETTTAVYLLRYPSEFLVQCREWKGFLVDETKRFPDGCAIQDIRSRCRFEKQRSQRTPKMGEGFVDLVEIRGSQNIVPVERFRQRVAIPHELGRELRRETVRK